MASDAYLVATAGRVNLIRTRRCLLGTRIMDPDISTPSLRARSTIRAMPANLRSIPAKLVVIQLCFFYYQLVMKYL